MPGDAGLLVGVNTTWAALRPAMLSRSESESLEITTTLESVISAATHSITDKRRSHFGFLYLSGYLVANSIYAHKLSIDVCVTLIFSIAHAHNSIPDPGPIQSSPVQSSPVQSRVQSPGFTLTRVTLWWTVLFFGLQVGHLEDLLFFHPLQDPYITHDT